MNEEHEERRDLPEYLTRHLTTPLQNWRFESAEGCYSYAALATPDIKVKYVVKAMTDFGGDDEASEGLKLLTRGAAVVVVKPGNDIKTYKSLTSENIYPSGPIEFYRDVGELFPVQNYRDVGKEIGKRGCMFWVPVTYQEDICVVDVGEDDTMQLVEGKLYKQKYELHGFPGGTSSAPFFHFQEWKRKFRNGQFNVVPSTLEGAFLMRKEGIARIPSTSDVDFSDSDKWQSSKRPHPQCSTVPFPTTTYCTAFGKSKNDNDRHKETHCVYTIDWFSPSVKIVSCPTLDPINYTPSDSITLALVVSLDNEHYVSTISRALDSWHSRPATLIIHSSSSDPDLTPLKLAHRRNVICVLVSEVNFNENAMSNMAVDAARTRWVLTGLDAGAGDILGDDTLGYLRRAVNKFKGEVSLEAF